MVVNVFTCTVAPDFNSMVKQVYVSKETYIEGFLFEEDCKKTVEYSDKEYFQRIK